MTPELTALTLAALLQVLQFVAYSISANLQVGPKTAMSSRDTLFIPAGQMHGFEADETMKMLFTFPVARFADVDYAFDEAA
ncbi:hypothetical protein SAMN05443551_3536 [Marivita hallyeonensis]|uniref:Uncharacterized protein n=1 Tax=Marivita hallyeonensis TaxID=996342 RepID=A0A1M5WV59_9RHOB|nr:hypothetical protein SAMN05443551_3536 [Marivita hallyeonensis]